MFAETVLIASARGTASWLWFPLVQRSLDRFCLQQNNHRVRRQADKVLPSGGTPDEFYKNPTAYGGKHCLVTVDMDVLDQLLDGCADGYAKMRYVDEAFEELAEAAYIALGSPEVTVHTVWIVFRRMIGQLL